MKKAASIILALFVSVSMFSQNIEDTPAIRTAIENLFENLDFTHVSSGYLRDYATDLVDLDMYNGIRMDDSSYVDISTLESIMRSIRSARVGGQTFPDITTLMSSMSEQTNCATIPVGSALYRYDYIREDAITGGYLSYTGGQVIDRTDAGGNWIDPYLQEYVFALSPASNVVGLSSTFTFGQFMLSNIEGVQIEVDLGDGSGYHTLSSTGGTSLTASYPRIGTYEMRARVTVGGRTLQTHSEVYAVDYIRSSPSSNDSRYTSQTFSTNYNGATVSAILYYLRGYTSISRPFIMVEGFQPKDLMAAKELEDTRDSRFTDLGPDILTDYEPFYVEWNNVEADIRANAKLLEDIIDYVNSMKVGNERNVMVGYSMGGLIARYALRTMEMEGRPHEVSSYISYDSPHFGVNVPLGAQYAINDLLYGTYVMGVSANNIWRVVGSMMNFFGSGDAIEYYDLLHKYINATSVKQMLINYVGPDMRIDNSVHEAWQAELENIGFPTGDPGFPMVKLAVSNGGTNELDPSQNFVDGNLDVQSSIIGSLLYSAICSGLLSMASSLVASESMILLSSPGKLNLHGSIAVSPYCRHNQTIYSSSLTYTKKLLWLVNLETNLHSCEVYSPSSGVIWDTANGSYYDLPLSTSDYDHDYSNVFLGDLNYSLHLRKRFMFVPTASSIALGGDYSSLSNSDCRRIDYTSSETPFDGIYMNDTWSYHTFELSDSLQYEWIYNSLQTFLRLDGPRTPVTGQGYSVTGFLANPAWSTTDPSVATVDADGVITVISTGFTTVQVTGVDQLGESRTLSMRIMTGIPEFVITQGDDVLRLTNYEAVCADNEFFDFADEIGAVYKWGVKNSTNLTTWTSGSSLNTTVNRYSVKWLYFKVESSFANSETYSLFVSRPIEFDPIVVTSDSTMFANGSDGEYVGVKSSSDKVVTYLVENRFLLTFDHIPDAVEFCRELIKDDEFERLLRSMRPWGEEDCLILGMTI
ncbi:MAG: hypothetical protein MJY83_00900, partial [Bacteroidales bacterium]|nr:hypothetical protein [Bacteroidales bacterium]